MDNSNTRLSVAIKRLGLTQKQLADELGTSQSAISAISNGSRPMTEGFVCRVESVYGINASWLLTGNGMMFKDGNDNTEQNKRTPVFDAETTGGSSGLVSSSSEGANVVGYVNSGSWFENKETAVIRHVGDSMVEYPDGCWLAVQKVLNPRLLVPGRNYVVETDEFRVTKRLQRGSEPNSIKLYSTNQEKYEDGQLIHEPFEVDLSDVRRIFSVLGYVVNQSGEIKFV